MLSGRTRAQPAMLPERELYYDCCYEVTSVGEIVWDWFAEEHAGELGVFRPLPADYGFGDWPHINTCEILPDSIRYYLAEDSTVSIGSESQPSIIKVNGREIARISYDTEKKTVTMNLPQGEGIVEIEK